MRDEHFDELIAFYRRSLIAKVQMREYDASWSHGILDDLRKRVAEHLAAEERYLDAEIVRRRQSADDMQAAVEEAEERLRSRGRW